MAKILVADDLESERRFVQSVLIEAGHEVCLAEDGAKALELLEQFGPQLVILDVVMPGKTGFDTCRAIKKNEATKDIPVILLTSKDADSDIFWGKKQGASEYMTKPFEPTDLVSTVAQYV